MTFLMDRNTYMATLFVGLVLAAWPTASIRAVCMLVGIMLVAWAVMTFLRGYRDGRDIRFMALGVLDAALGIFFIVAPAFLVSIVPIVIGIFVMAHALWRMVLIIRFGEGTARTIGLVYSVIVLLVGLFVVFNPLSMVRGFVRIIGISLVLSSFFGLVELG